MKFGVLKAIAHNLADSAADGMGFLIGVYAMDVFGEARATPDGYIEADFLTGETSGGQPSASLARALKLYAQVALPQLCERHNASPSDFRQLKVRFQPGRMSPHFKITVEDQNGRQETTHYEGLPAKRLKVVDHLGRVRSK